MASTYSLLSLYSVSRLLEDARFLKEERWETLTDPPRDSLQQQFREQWPWVISLNMRNVVAVWEANILIVDLPRQRVSVATVNGEFDVFSCLQSSKCDSAQIKSASHRHTVSEISIKEATSERIYTFVCALVQIQGHAHNSTMKTQRESVVNVIWYKVNTTNLQFQNTDCITVLKTTTMAQKTVCSYSFFTVKDNLYTHI